MKQREDPLYSIKDVENMLRRYRKVGPQIDWLRAELRLCKEQEEELRNNITCRRIDAMPHGAGGRMDPTLKVVEYIIDKSQARAMDFAKRIKDLLQEREQVDTLLKRLEEEEHSILLMRWIEQRSWVYISMKVYLCQRQCQRVQHRALGKILKMINLAQQDKEMG